MYVVVTGDDMRKFLQDKKLKVVAEKSGVPLSTLRNINSSTVNNPNISTAIKLSKYIIDYSNKYSYHTPSEKSLYAYRETKRAIDYGGYLFDRHVIASAYLWAHMETFYRHLTIDNVHKHKLLKSMNYHYHGLVKFKKLVLVIWTKKKMNNSQIRSYLSCKRLQYRRV